MKNILFSISLLLCAQFVHSQNINVNGTITNKNNKPVKGANISIKNSYDGTTSDSVGKFSFVWEDKQNDSLQVTATDYIPFEIRLKNENKDIHLNIQLLEEISELNAVVVTSAGSFMTGNNKNGVVVMSSLDVVTTSQNADITSALKFLPGAQQVGEAEGLFVRGGTGAETKQYMDGAVIHNPYFRGNENFAQRGRFNPYLFEGTTFSTGAYSALYGDALSSVVLLNTVDLPRQSEVSFTVSPIMLGSGFQKLTKDKQKSFGVNYGFTTVAPYYSVFNSVGEFFKGPAFHTADANFRAKTKRGGMLKTFVSFGYNKIGMRMANVDSSYLNDETDIQNRNIYANIFWEEYLNNGWKMSWSNSYTNNLDKINSLVVDKENNAKQFSPEIYWMNNKFFKLNNEQNSVQSRLVFEKKLKQLDRLRMGVEYNFYQVDFNYNNINRLLKDNYSAAFAEMDKYFTKHLALTVGARAEYSSLIGKTNLAPRASMVYRIAPGNIVSAAYGIFYQRPENEFLLVNDKLNYTKAHHYLINYTYANKLRLFRAEVYYKQYNDLIKTIPVNVYQRNYNNNGNGYAKGVDIFWKDKQSIPGFEYWLSYSYIDTKRDFLNYSSMLQPAYATPHTFSVVAKKFFMPIKTQFNLTYTFATGRPYYFFAPDNTGGFNKLDEGKTINYNNVGFSINYVPSVGKLNAKNSVVYVFTVSNLLNSKHIYGYNYSYNGQFKTPIVPMSRQFFFIGCFINIGADRSQQVINNNL